MDDQRVAGPATYSQALVALARELHQMADEAQRRGLYDLRIELRRAAHTAESWSDSADGWKPT